MREWVEDRYGNITRHYWWTPDFGGLPHVLGSVKKIQGGTETTNFVYGQGLLAREIDNTFTYFLIGDNDNVIALADDNGDITDRYEYSTFGELLSHTGSDANRILFSTEPNDEDTGLIYLRSRYYDPGVGRFLSEDLISLFGINLYIYCRNNPVGWNDHNGLDERAYGVGTTIIGNSNNPIIIWTGKDKKGNPVRYRLNQYNEKNKKRRAITAEILKYLSDEFAYHKAGNKAWNCYSWRDKFVAVKESGKKVVVSPCTTTMFQLQNRIAENIGVRPTAVMPYYQVLPNSDFKNAVGHTYVYLQFKFQNQEDIWIFTEANASKDPTKAQGNIHYQSYQVKPPDVFP